MFCKRWHPTELFPKADLLAAILLRHKYVTGVALTGSLARREQRIHDIDLVVFHDGALMDGFASDPPGPAEHEYEGSFPLDTAFIAPEGELVRSLRHASSGTPVNYIFVEEKVLWDCGCLQSLEAKEHFKDFYLRVFCDIPLVLLRPRERKGLLQEKIDYAGIFWPCDDLSSITGLSIGHKCANPRCKPRETWAECRRRIKLRKMHWWHLFS